MEKHNCKLCSRSFASGRALGGHMRSHLVTYPPPPKTPQKQEPLLPPPLTAVSTTSGECCSEEVFSTGEDQKAVYGLRKNPKKSLRSPDAGVEAAQDGESETESARKPTGRRSKRSRRRTAPPPPCSTDQSVVSSVTDSSTDEDLAMCLMMLSRDVWSSSANNDSVKKQRKKKKVKISVEEEDDINGGDFEEVARNVVDRKVHECPFCGKVFGSGQALGGHKRSHLPSTAAATTTTTTTSTSTTTAKKMFFIDLNLPAPVEEEDCGVQVMQEVCAVS